MASFTWPTIGSGSGITIGSPANGLSLAGTVLSLGLSSSSTVGALSSADWSTFNSKQSALTLGNLTDVGTDGITITSGTGAVVGSGTSIAQHVADSTHNGYLSSTDWSTFNNKQATITTGNLTDVGTDGITITSGTGAVIGSGTSIAQHVADATHNGYLSSTDWSTFNSKQSTITTGNLTEATSSIFTITGGTGAVIGSGTSIKANLTSANFYVGNASNVAVGVAMSGDIALTNAGATSYSGTVPIGKGGTNITTYATGDLLYASATNVLSKLTAGTSGTFLKQGASIPAWAFTYLAANAQSTNYTLVAADQTVNFTTSTNSLVATLPTAVGVSGQRYTINKVDQSTGKVTINTTSSQTIGSWALASGVILLATKGDTITLESDGANWQVTNWGITVAAKQQDTSGFSVANDNAFHTVTMGTRIIDTYQGFGSGTYTTVIPGTYLVGANANFASASWVATDQVRGQIAVNGTAIILQAVPLNVTATYVVPVNMTTTAVQLAAGDTVVFQLKQNDAGARTLDTGVGQNTISLIRIGN